MVEVSAVQAISITPTELLDRFKKGERPEYQPNNDKIIDELNVLSEQYKQSMSVDKKAKILDKEREVLYDELLHPELTLSRNYEAVSKMMPKEFTPQEIEDTLRLFNITGIKRIERLGGAYQTSTPKENINILAEAYCLMDETTTSGKRGRGFVISALKGLEKNAPNYYGPGVQNAYKELMGVTKDKDLTDALVANIAEIDSVAVIKKLKEKPYDDFLFRTLLEKSPRQSNETREFVTEVLSHEKDYPDIIRTAILGGGKFRSDENFEIIRNIALDTTEKDVRKREFALHSTALYIKEKPEEVKEVLQTVAKEKSIFAPLGRILHDKVTGNYHGKEHRELKYAGYSKRQIKNFNDVFDKYFESDVELTPRLRNTCELNVMPFRRQLKGFVGKGFHYIVQNDTYTKQDPDNVGKRYFYEPAGIYNAGDYMDAFDGINAPKYNMMNPYRVGSSSHQNQMAHEIGHAVHRNFSNKDKKIITSLYEKAKKEGRTLDYYADANVMEYFAQGCDAFTSIYKPHESLMSTDPQVLGLSHTIYELMDRDPDLYRFIKKSLRKYR